MKALWMIAIVVALVWMSLAAVGQWERSREAAARAQQAQKDREQLAKPRTYDFDAEKFKNWRMK